MSFFSRIIITVTMLYYNGYKHFEKYEISSCQFVIIKCIT